MIWILLWVLVIIGLVMMVAEVKSSGSDGLFAAISAVSFVLTAVTFLIYLIAFAESTSSNAKLRAFAGQNKAAYEETARLTQDMVTGGSAQKSQGVLVDSSSLEQVKIASQRLMEYRDEVIEYNLKLRSKREYYQHWWLRMWMAEPPAELNYIDFPVK